MTIAAVTAINRSKRLVLLDSGEVVPIDVMLDDEGDETTDPNECFIAIVQLPDGGWACCDLLDYEDAKTQ